ncbi:MAG: DUF3152 domain-containing protein [Candidatus Saccharimonadales bacterium]
MRSKLYVLLLIPLLLFSMVSIANVKAVDNQDDNSISETLLSLQMLPSTISKTKSPEIKTPDWLQEIYDAETIASYSKRTIPYNVTTRGIITADFAEFKTLANQTLNDSRGWARMGITFQQVSSGGSFTLVLSEASQVPTFAPTVCSADWSCQVGNYVIINQNKWLYASDAWNNAGGSLRDYQHMVINHETGHWLRHPHEYCGGAGQLAPIMQQQSIDLQGCKFNSWPLNSELWSGV